MKPTLRFIWRLSCTGCRLFKPCAYLGKRGFFCEPCLRKSESAG